MNRALRRPKREKDPLNQLFFQRSYRIENCEDPTFITSKSKLNIELGSGSNMFDFHPYLGRWSNLTNIFQRGWNHQLVNISRLYHLDRKFRSWETIPLEIPKCALYEKWISYPRKTDPKMKNPLVFFWGFDACRRSIIYMDFSDPDLWMVSFKKR